MAKNYISKTCRLGIMSWQSLKGGDYANASILDFAIPGMLKTLKKINV